MSRWAILATLFTGAGVLLIWLTLRATKEAAHYAKLAADAGKEAVRQAELTNVTAFGGR